MPRIRTFAPQEWKIYKDLRLRALADSPTAFGSTLAEEQKRTDAEWSNRLAAGTDSGMDLPIMAEVEQKLIGLAWGRINRSNPDAANLYQMWVAPGHRRLGIGKMLLEAIVAWAKAKNVSSLNLDVTFRESPAMRFYTTAGFEPSGEPQPFRPGSDVLGLPMRLKL